MKEIYGWVPWFRELAKKVAKEDEDYLIKRAKNVEWGKSRALVEFGDEAIDPLSFFYFLASKNTRNQLKPVYASISEVFEINPLDTNLDDEFYYPTPKFKILFHDGKKPSSNLLWRLFRQAIEDKPRIAQDDFMEVLNIQNVAVPKLTQALFLINPEFFLPVDDSYDVLSETRGFSTARELQNEISEDGGYGKYQSFLRKIREAFPGCQPYEINMFLYLLNSGTLEVNNDFYQVSTQVMGHNEGDYWDDGEDNFKDNYWVYTGGPGDDKLYPLADPKQGDVILVRTGREKGKAKGRAIGVVYQNDYVPDGWNEKRRIHVLWINKSEGKLAANTPILGFSKAGTKSREAFERIKNYGHSLDLIGKLKKSSSASEQESEPEAQHQEADPKKSRHYLNQILYGPPGTSKTWHTINHALAIIDNKPVDPLVKESKAVRKEKSRRFNELKKNGQIEMVTFHQNYNYEDFIEGIRPVLDDDGSGSVEYELVPGVFRRIVKRADENKTQSEQASGESWDIDALIEAFAESIVVKLESKIGTNLFPPDHRSGATIGAVHWTGNTFKSVQLGGTVKHQRLTRSVIKRDYKAFYNGDIKSKEDIEPTYKSRRSYHGNARYYLELYKQIKDFHDNEWKPEAPVSVEKQNYVLIIDEINRGNIAKIFGELITLIEESKRLGRGDATTVRLPNSQDEDEDEEFGVPDNLYIIGTMNTADRSIALLDTALRRRFDFVEMMPDSKLVSGKFEGVDCRKLLEAINKRVRFLLDRERQIGHTYFMNIHNLTTLKAAFKNRIIPLLQEYFFDNWEKIDLVLNGNGFIQKTRIESDLFKDSDLIEDQTEIYELLPFDDVKWKDPEQYRKIYENNKQGDAGGSDEDA